MPHWFRPNAITGLITIAGICGAAAPAWAQSTDQGVSTATVVQSLQVTKVDDLAFGPILSGDLGGTINIDAATGTVTSGGDVSALPGARNRAKFTANAPLGMLFLIVGDPATTLTRSGGGGSMIATLDYSAASGIGTLPLPPYQLMAIAATQEIDVGGTLTVGAAQAPGDYSGTFSLTVTYL